MSDNALDLAKLLGGKVLKPFRPLAYYDRHMDCIRIELRDCSITERRVSETITVLLDNFPEPKQSEIAGLMIKGVRHLFSGLEIPMTGVLYVTGILDKLAES